MPHHLSLNFIIIPQSVIRFNPPALFLFFDSPYFIMSLPIRYPMIHLKNLFRCLNAVN